MCDSHEGRAGREAGEDDARGARHDDRRKSRGSRVGGKTRCISRNVRAAESRARTSGRDTTCRFRADAESSSPARARYTPTSVVPAHTELTGGTRGARRPHAGHHFGFLDRSREEVRRKFDAWSPHDGSLIGRRAAADNRDAADRRTIRRCPTPAPACGL